MLLQPTEHRRFHHGPDPRPVQERPWVVGFGQVTIVLTAVVAIHALAFRSQRATLQEIPSAPPVLSAREINDLERAQRICSGVDPRVSNAVMLTCRHLQMR